MKKRFITSGPDLPCTEWITKDKSFLVGESEDCNRSERMPYMMTHSLILGFLIWRLKCLLINKPLLCFIFFII